MFQDLNATLDNDVLVGEDDTSYIFGLDGDDQIIGSSEDEFIDGCEKAIERYKESPVNKEGLKLQEQFPYSATVEQITNIINA